MPHGRFADVQRLAKKFVIHPECQRSDFLALTGRKLSHLKHFGVMALSVGSVLVEDQTKKFLVEPRSAFMDLADGPQEGLAILLPENDTRGAELNGPLMNADLITST